MIYIDSDKKRFYEVPSVAHTVEILPNGLRRYTPTVVAPDIVTIDLLAGIYSPWVIHRSESDGDHADLAFRRVGGAVTQEDQSGKTNAPTELFIRNDYGWRIVLANHPHELKILGNLRPQDASLRIFDFEPLDILGAYPAIERSSNLIVRTVYASNSVTPDQARELMKDALKTITCE